MAGQDSRTRTRNSQVYIGTSRNGLYGNARIMDDKIVRNRSARGRGRRPLHRAHALPELPGVGVPGIDRLDGVQVAMGPGVVAAHVGLDGLIEGAVALALALPAQGARPRPARRLGAGAERGEQDERRGTPRAHRYS